MIRLSGPPAAASGRARRQEYGEAPNDGGGFFASYAGLPLLFLQCLFATDAGLPSVARWSLPDAYDRPVLIALILFGVAVVAVAVVLLLRSAPVIKAREARYPDPEQVESEVYEKLYGKRSGTVSAPLPVEPPPKADPDSPNPHTP